MSETPPPNAKDIFLELIDQGEAERRDALEALGRQDPELKARVERLLLAHEAAEVTDALAPLADLKGGAQFEGGTSWGEAGGPGDRGDSMLIELPMTVGNYELLSEIASGGSGIVYRARQTTLGREVAVKLLRSGTLATVTEVRRFRSEAETAARLDHPNIVPIYEVGAHEGRHYIGMKLIEGHSLDACIEGFRNRHRAAAALLVVIARAVHHGHQRGVLHRDLKPSNILLDDRGTPFVTDFGTAKLLDDSSRRTHTQFICGTPAYMAPEQTRVQAEVTVATDVYALGCILHELLTGTPPFEGQGLVDLLRRIQDEAPKNVRATDPGIHRDLGTICLHCLDKEPGRRYESALALALDLERWLALEPIHARPVTLMERFGLAWRRKPLVAGLVSMVGVLLVVLGVGAAVSSVVLQKHLDRALEAEELAESQLRTALVAQARALRRSDVPGRRAQAMALLTEAAALGPGEDLRREAPAALALTDLDVLVERDFGTSTDNHYRTDATSGRYLHWSDDGRAELRSLADDTLVLEIPHPGTQERTERVGSIGFGPHGRYLAIVYGFPGQLRRTRMQVWDIEQAAMVHEDPGDISTPPVFARTSAELVFGTASGTVRVIDLAKGTPEQEYRVSESALWRVAVTPRADRIAFGVSGSRHVAWFDVVTGAQRVVSDARDDSLFSIAWSSDGGRIAAACGDFKVRVWDAERGSLEGVFEGHRAEVITVEFDPTGDLIATTSWDESTRIWDSRTRESLVIAPHALASNFSTDGTRLGFVRGGAVGVWRVEHSGVLRTLHGHEGKAPRRTSFSREGRWLATAEKGRVLIREHSSGETLDELRMATAERPIFDPIRDRVYMNTSNGIQVVPYNEDGFEQARAVTWGQGRVRDLAVSPGGAHLAVLFSAGMLRLVIMNTSDGSEHQEIAVPSGSTSISMDPDSRWVSTGNWRGSGARVWNVETGELEAEFHVDEESVSTLFDPKGRWLVTGGTLDYVFWEVGTWREVRRVPRGGWTNLPGTMAFSSDGALFASGATRWRADLYSSESGEYLAGLVTPHPISMGRMSFDPEARFLVVATGHERVLSWDLHQLRHTIHGAKLDEGLEAHWPLPSPLHTNTQ